MGHSLCCLWLGGRCSPLERARSFLSCSAECWNMIMIPCSADRQRCTSSQHVLLLDLRLLPVCAIPPHHLWSWCSGSWLQVIRIAFTMVSCCSNDYDRVTTHVALLGFRVAWTFGWRCFQAFSAVGLLRTVPKPCIRASARSVLWPHPCGPLACVESFSPGRCRAASSWRAVHLWGAGMFLTH